MGESNIYSYPDVSLLDIDVIRSECKNMVVLFSFGDKNRRYHRKLVSDFSF